MLIVADIPDYFTTWSALITTLLTLLLPQPLISPVALALASAFGVGDESVLFLEKYQLIFVSDRVYLKFAF